MSRFVRLLLPAVLMLSFALIANTTDAQTTAGTISPAGAANVFVPLDPFVQVKAMQRGVNIVGYDPIWKDFEQRRFKQPYFKLLRDGGFNTVRINLQAFAHMDSLNRLSPEWFKTLDWVVDNALVKISQ